MSDRLRNLVRRLTLLAALSLASAVAQQVGTVASAVATPRSTLADALSFAGVALADDAWTFWGASPVRDDDGRVHLFVARWPEPNVDPAWRRSSQIAHYAAVDPAHPEGPFAFRGVVLEGSGVEGSWDRYAPHNPEVRRVGGRFVLTYIANDDFHQPPHPLNQRIGMAVADSLDGPWTKVGSDKPGLVLGPSEDPAHWTHGRQVVNPSLLEVDGRFHLYFKSSDRESGRPRYGLAVAERLEGPYRMTDAPLTPPHVVLEDASAFVWDGRVCLLTTDNAGALTGVAGAGILWVSEDGGFTFPRELAQLGFDLLVDVPGAAGHLDVANARRVYGRAPKLERPKLLVDAAGPAWLYGPSGWALHGGGRTGVYALRVTLPPGAGPMPAFAAPALARPTPAQLAWQDAELGVLISYDLHVFDDRHYVQRDNRVQPFDDPNRFAPEDLSTDQWLDVARAMGARFAILTASHETGFRLWQSDANPYCLKAVRWGDGKRDLVAEFVASCRAHGIAPGIYLGTRWNSQLGVYDFRVTARSTLTQAQYNRLIEAEVEEICTRYGPLFEIWFDGGAFGPARGGPDVQRIVERFQPDALFYHNDDRADARWGGTESGTVPYPCWARMPFAGSGGPGKTPRIQADNWRLFKHGDEDGRHWCPAMADAPIRNHEWFWDADDEHKLRSAGELFTMYDRSVGRNATLILGLTPDDRGLIPTADAAVCRAFGELVAADATNCLGSVTGAGDALELAFAGPTTVARVVLQEDIAEGERVRAYVLEARDADGGWTPIAQGSCIGHKRIERLASPVTTTALRVRIPRAVATPHMRRFAAY